MIIGQQDTWTTHVASSYCVCVLLFFRDGGQWDLGDYFCPSRAFRPYRKLAANKPKPLPHTYQSDSSSSTLQVRIKTFARVRDAETDAIRIGPQVDSRPSRLNVIHDIG